MTRRMCCWRVFGVAKRLQKILLGGGDLGPGGGFGGRFGNSDAFAYHNFFEVVVMQSNILIHLL